MEVLRHGDGEMDLRAMLESFDGVPEECKKSNANIRKLENKMRV